MSNNLKQFMQRFVHANNQRKHQPVQHSVPANKNVQRIQNMGGDAITKTTTFKLSDEQYRTSLIAKAIVCINKHKGVI
ncbi:hypothetical protein [Pseudomonas gregormendelii]